MKRLILCLIGSALGAAMLPAQGDLGTPAFVMTLDFDQWHADFPASTLAQLWDEPAVQNMRSQALASLAEDVGVAPEALSQSFTGQMGLAVMMSGADAGGMPSFTYGLAFRQPGQGEALAAQIRSAASQGGQSVDDHLSVSQDVVVLGDSTALREALAQQFTAGATGLGIEPAASSFANMRCNLAALAGTAGQDPTSQRVINALGLGNIDAMEASGAFQGAGLGWNLDVITQGARSGLMDLFGPPGEFQTIHSVPMEVASVSAVRLKPLTQILDTVRTAMITSGDPAAEQQFQQMMIMPAMFGIDVQGLLAAVGPEVTVADRASATAVIMQSSNPDLIMQTVQNLVPMMAGMMGAQPGQVPTGPRQVTEGNTTFMVMDLPGGGTLSMGRVGEDLVIAQGTTLMQDIIGAAAGGANVTQGILWDVSAEDLQRPTSLLVLSDDSTTMRQLTGEPQMLMAMGVDAQGIDSLRQVADVIAEHGGHSVTTLSTAPDRLSLKLNSSTGMEVLGLLMMVATATDFQGGSMPTATMQPTMTPMPTSPKP